MLRLRSFLWRAPAQTLQTRGPLRAFRLVALKLPNGKRRRWGLPSAALSTSAGGSDETTTLAKSLANIDKMLHNKFISPEEAERLKGKVREGAATSSSSSDAPISSPLGDAYSSSSSSSSSAPTEEGKSDSEFSDLNMEGFEAENDMDPNDAKGILGGLPQVDENAVFDDEYADVLDPRNPPRLDHRHYQLLKGIDWREWALRERSKLQQRGKIDSSKPSPFSHEIDENEMTRLSKEDIMSDPYLKEGNDYSIRRYAEEPGKDRLLPDILPPRGANRTSCLFCEPDPTPNQTRKLAYTNVQLLLAYINERGMILPRRMNGNCAKHQRKVRLAIMQAREVGLLAYTSDWVATADMGKREEADTDGGDVEVTILSDDEEDGRELQVGQDASDVPVDKRLLRLEREKKRLAKLEFVKTETREESKKGLGTKRREERASLRGVEDEEDIFVESRPGNEASDDDLPPGYEPPVK